MTETFVRSRFPRARTAGVLILYSLLVAAVGFTRGLTAGFFLLGVMTVLAVTGAVIHRAKALHRGVPTEHVWDVPALREVKLTVRPQDALPRVREALATLPNARVGREADRSEIGATVSRGLGMYRSRIVVQVDPAEGGSRVRAAARSLWFTPLDWGSNWEYLNLFVRALERDAGESERQS
jgi:hypothetical protein